jgi:hypothetical protein
MIETKELLEIKARMLLAAEAANRIAGGGDQLELEPDAYELVMSALAALKDDARAVLSELDILRGMTTGSFDSLFGALLAGKATKKEHEHGRSSDVGGVQPEASVGGGSVEPDDHTATGGAVRPDGPDGPKGKRSRPRRNSRRNKKDQEPVES